MNRMTYVEIAKLAHTVNREYCRALDDKSHLPWDQAPEWQRNSAIKGVEAHLISKNMTPEESHDSWMKQKLDEGWEWGPEKDVEKKQHPCLVDYYKLPVAQRAKDHIFKGICDYFKEAFCEPSIAGIKEV